MSLYVDCRAQHYVYSKTCNSELQQIQIYKKQTHLKEENKTKCTKQALEYMRMCTERE